MKSLRILLTSLFVMGTFAAGAQEKAEQLPYLKYPTLPAFNLLKMDSSEVINMYYAKSDKPTVLFFFSPDCEHCQITTNKLMAKMDSMQHAYFYFMTFMPLSELRPFAKLHHFENYKNIIPGKDYQFFFPKFYGATTVPYLAIYDKHKQFVKLYDGAIRVPEIHHILDSLSVAN